MRHPARSRFAADAAFTPGRFCLALVLLVIALFPDVLFGGRSFFYRDFGLFGYPLAAFHKEVLWQGGIPLWNPYNSCGLPFMAQWNTMVFYPGSMLYLLLPLPWSLNLFCLVHLVLAGMSMYWLVHAWTKVRLAATVAGFAYTFNGLMFHCLMWPNNIAALAWLPLVVLLVERAWRRGGRWVAWAALAGAMQVLSGGPEVILFTWLILGGWWLVHVGGRIGRVGWGWERLTQPLSRLALVGCLVAGLTAVQLLPFLDLLAVSHRSANFGDSVWAMPAWGWANLLVPLFHTSPSLAGVYSQDAQQWTSSYYLGVCSLALATVALLGAPRRHRSRIFFLGATFFLGLVLALGDHGFLYRWLREAFPMLGFARFPVKFVVVSTWALPVLAGFGVRHLVRSEGRSAWRRLGPLAGVSAGMTALMIMLMWLAKGNPVEGEDVRTTLTSGLSRSLILLLFVGVSAGLVRHRRGPVYLASAGLACALAIIDGITHTPSQNPTVSAKSLAPRSAHERDLPALGEGRAMVSPRVRLAMTAAGHPDPEQHTLGYRAVATPNWNLLDRVPLVDGFFSLYPRHLREVWQLLYEEDEQGYPEPLVDFLGVTRVTSDQTLFGWESRSRAMPLVTGGQGPLFLNEPATLARLKSQNFDPRTEVLLDEKAEELWKDFQSAPVYVREMVHEENAVRVEVEAGARTWLVISQTYSPHWQAWVDGREVPVLRANHAFQAIPLEAGEGTVKLIYREPLFRVGSLVSAGFWLGSLWWGRPWKRFRRNKVGWKAKIAH